MKKIYFLPLLILLFACSEDDTTSCADTDNAVISGDCYWGFLKDYDVEGEWSTDGQLVKILSEEVMIEFRGAGPTYTLSINGGHSYYDPSTQQWMSDQGLLVEGNTYTDQTNSGTGMFLPNILSSNAFTITLTKVDRENKLISGFFRWDYTAANAIGDGQGDIVVEGTFTDVIVNISDQI